MNLAMFRSRSALIKFEGISNCDAGLVSRQVFNLRLREMHLTRDSDKTSSKIAYSRKYPCLRIYEK